MALTGSSWASIPRDWGRRPHRRCWVARPCRL